MKVIRIEIDNSERAPGVWEARETAQSIGHGPLWEVWCDDQMYWIVCIPNSAPDAEVEARLKALIYGFACY